MTTRDEIIGMARESSMEEINDVLFYASDDNLAKFAALAIAKDRERRRPLNLLPQKDGQGSMMTITEGPDTSPPEVGHWYSPDKVASMLLAEGDRRAAAEREACIKVCEAIQADKWALYKGRPPYTGQEKGRADSHTDGMSDGASLCVDALLARGAQQ